MNWIWLLLGAGLSGRARSLELCDHGGLVELSDGAKDCRTSTALGVSSRKDSGRP
jgi:hypothetical protein